MCVFIFLFYFFFLIFSFNCLTDHYTLSNIGENLFLYSPVYEYTLYEKKLHNFNVKLTKRISKMDNKIFSKNYLSVDNNEEKEVKFNDIGSFHIIDKKLILCPRGKFHPVVYNDNLDYKIPGNFIETEKWDLKCYQIKDEIIQVIYLMNGKNNSFIFSKNGYKLDENKLYFDNIYDFKLVKENNENKDSIFYISLVQGNIELINSNPKIIKSNIITKAKSFSQAYFDEKNYFYFITFNNATDFVSGYGFLDENNEFNSLNLKINTKLPLYFDENIEIKEINFVSDNSYIFYKIIYKSDDKLYNGVIDIKLNKIIFKINEEIELFSFYPISSFLIITTFSVYKIPIMKNNLILFHEKAFFSSKCAEHCKTYASDSCHCTVCDPGFKNVDNLCIECNDTHCVNWPENSCDCTKCEEKYYLNITGNICKECDDNCYTCKESSTKCTGCKNNTFLEGEKCYNCTECKKTKSSTDCRCEECNEGKYLVNHQCFDCMEGCKTCITRSDLCHSCKDGYYFNEFKCLPCYELCGTCNKGSNDKQNQQCETCKPNYIIFNHNCLEQCPEGYFESENTCKECNKLCKTTRENCNSCSSCFDGYYLVEMESRCNKCNEHCQTCSNAASEDNENCESCDINSEYKYLVNATGFGKNCVSICPNGTILQANSTCIISIPEIVENKPPEEKSNVLVIVFSIIGSLVFIGIIIFLFIHFRNRKKKIEVFKPDDISNDQLIKEINKDLNLYQSFN